MESGVAEIYAAVQINVKCRTTKDGSLCTSECSTLLRSMELHIHFAFEMTPLSTLHSNAKLHTLLTFCPKEINKNCEILRLPELVIYVTMYISRWIASTPLNSRNTAKIKEDKPV